MKWYFAINVTFAFTKLVMELWVYLPGPGYAELVHQTSHQNVNCAQVKVELWKPQNLEKFGLMSAVLCGSLKLVLATLKKWNLSPKFLGIYYFYLSFFNFLNNLYTWASMCVNSISVNSFLRKFHLVANYADRG